MKFPGPELYSDLTLFTICTSLIAWLIKEEPKADRLALLSIFYRLDEVRVWYSLGLLTKVVDRSLIGENFDAGLFSIFNGFSLTFSV